MVTHRNGNQMAGGVFEVIVWDNHTVLVWHSCVIENLQRYIEPHNRSSPTMRRFQHSSEDLFFGSKVKSSSTTLSGTCIGKVTGLRDAYGSPYRDS